METILLIEDDHDTRVSMRQMLEAEGYFVFSATNGIDGLATLNRIKRPKVVLLDQNLPLMSGDEFLTLKGRDKAIAPIPVIAFSAVPDRLTKLGAAAFIPKPVSLDDLLETIERIGISVTA